MSYTITHNSSETFTLNHKICCILKKTTYVVSNDEPLDSGWSSCRSRRQRERVWLSSCQFVDVFGRAERARIAKQRMSFILRRDVQQKDVRSAGGLGAMCYPRRLCPRQAFLNKDMQGTRVLTHERKKGKQDRTDGEFSVFY